MKIDEVEEYFGSSAEFQALTGMSRVNYYNWRVRGYVPLKSQLLLEQLTHGKLKMNYQDCETKYDTRRKR